MTVVVMVVVVVVVVVTGLSIVGLVVLRGGKR